ncbi:hypothetical protein KSS87_023222, partial [Heliosperma pusillum]
GNRFFFPTKTPIHFLSQLNLSSSQVLPIQTTIYNILIKFII